MSDHSITTEAGRSPSGLVCQMGMVTFCRVLLNTARRFAYPFAPALGRGLGVSLTAVTSLIAVNQVTAVLGLVFGPLGDRWGYRIMLLAGLACLAVGNLTGGFFPFYGTVLAALFLAGLGKSVFDPAVQAYLGERVPYERRAMVIGITEMAWAGSSLVGIPLVGLVIDRLGWRSPFLILGGFGLAGMFILWWLIPPDQGSSTSSGKTFSVVSAWRRLGLERTPLGLLCFAFFTSFANDNFFVVYGAWLEGTFRLSIVALGMATMVIGGAELLGEVATAFLADRVGLRRAVLIGVVFSGISYVGLPFSGRSLTLVLTALFLIFFTVEFAIVTSLSLCTEVLADARATMMSGYLAAAGVGRVMGALLGGLVWKAGGIKATGFVSALLVCLSLAGFVWGMRGWRPQPAKWSGDISGDIPKVQ